MDRNKENVPATKRCGYCGALLRDEVFLNIWSHGCFENYNEETDTIEIDRSYIVTISVKHTDKLKEWDEKWDELLIKEMSLRPPLYNYTLDVRERTNLKLAHLWKEIYNCLRVPCELKTMQQRWKYLKQMYMETKQVERAYKPSGSAASGKCTLEFKLYEMMGFLDDLCKPSRTVTSLTSESESPSEAEEQNEEVRKTKNKRQMHETLFASLTSKKKKSQKWIRYSVSSYL